MPDAEDRSERKRAAERGEDKAQHASERRTDLATAEVIQAGAAAQANRLELVARELVAAANKQVERDWRNRLLGLAVLVLSAAGVAGAWFGYWSSRDNGDILAQVKTTAEQVESCTTPDGECAQRGQAGQAAAVGSINDRTALVIQIAVVCADEQHGRTAIEACIHERSRQAGLEK